MKTYKSDISNRVVLFWSFVDALKVQMSFHLRHHKKIKSLIHFKCEASEVLSLFPPILYSLARSTILKRDGR